MPKKVFWPLSLIVMGLLFLSANIGIVPREFWNLWPLLLIIVGLGGWLTSDRDEWMYEPKAPSKKASAKPSSTKKAASKRKK
jgi:hypothetical protein